MRLSAKVAGFVALCVACVSVSVVYLVHADRRESLASASTPGVVEDQAPDAVAALRAGPHVAFRSMAPGQAGRLALAPLDDPGGTRILTDLECLRIHVAAGNGLCLSDKGSLFTPYDIVFLGPDLESRHTESLAGLISRARVSPDGRYGAATVFVTGHSYAPVTCSTQTTLHDMTT